MATIRLTDELNKQLLAGAMQVFHQRSIQAGTPPPEFNLTTIYELWLDSDVELRRDIAMAERRGWLATESHLELKNLNGIAVNLIMTGKPPVAVPHPLAGYNRGIDLNGVRAGELLEIWRAWKANLDHVIEAKDTYKENIKALLSRHKSLKQALTEWPALWEFVPGEIKTRHNEQKEARERTADKPKAAVDLDVLNGAVVTAKILKSSSAS